jgi:hypothetical protein
VFPACIDPHGWPALFTSDEDRRHISELIPDYVTGGNDDAAVTALLEHLDVRHVPPPRMVRVRDEKHPTAFERRLIELHPYGADKLVNYRPFSWMARLTEGGDPAPFAEAIEALCEWLDFWDRKRRRSAFSRADEPLAWERAALNEYGIQREVDSELACELRSRPWVPSTKGLQVPANVFVDTEENRGIFGEDIPYLRNVNRHYTRSLLRRGVNEVPTPKTLHRFLCAQARTNAKPSVDVATKIYKILASDPTIVPSASDPLIYFPSSSKPWRTAIQTTWKDLSVVLGDDRRGLDKTYPAELQSLFAR